MLRALSICPACSGVGASTVDASVVSVFYVLPDGYSGTRDTRFIEHPMPSLIYKGNIE